MAVVRPASSTLVRLSPPSPVLTPATTEPSLQRLRRLWSRWLANHGFADGNKRTAMILLNLLLERSGHRLNSPEDSTKSIQQEVEEMILAIARGQLSFDELVGWFGKRLKRA